MTQEKDQKPVRGPGPGKVSPKTMVGTPQLPSTRLPRPSDALSGGPSSPLSSGPSRRDGAPEPTRVASVPSKAPAGLRHDEGLVEEISSSLLLPDDSSSGVMPGLEELSGSLLLEDPAEVRPEPTAASAHSAAKGQPTGAERRTVVGMPELPTSTPGPNLDALLPDGLPSSFSHGLPSAGLAARSAPLPPEGSVPTASHTADRAPLENQEVDEATRVLPPPPKDMYDALKGYEAAAPPIAEGGGIAGPAEAPAPEPASQTAPLQGDVEVTSMPRSPGVKAVEAMQEAANGLRAKFETALGSRDDRPRWFLPAIAFGGLVVGIAAVALIVSLTRTRSDQNAETNEAKVTFPEPSAAPPAPTEGPQTAPTASAETLAPAPAPPEAVASTAACAVAGTAHVLARSALVSAGIEVRTLGDDVALGFAPDDHEAKALRLDPSSLATRSKVDAQSSEPIRRVMPVLSTDGALSLAGDADREGDSVAGRRTLPLDPPLEVGLEHGAAGASLVWARPGGTAAGKLWPLDGDGALEALRGAVEFAPVESPPLSAIAFRRAGAIWLGVAKGRDALAPLGELREARSSGAAVGSPAIAMNGGVVVAAWADRAEASDPWRLRWVTFKAGEPPGEPGTFTPPAGGRGEQAMSPGITAVPGGRFLLVWTEGPATRHDVRALTLSREGQPLGKPLVISNKNVNAGQGQAAVNAAGRGVVAFLESADGGFRVVAMPIKCSR